MAVFPFFGAPSETAEVIDFGEPIGTALRFSKENSTYLGRSFVTGNRRKYTFSTWFKRGNDGVHTFIYGTSIAANGDTFGIEAGGTIGINVAGWYTNFLIVCNDPGQWYHFLVHVDTDNATAAQRVRLFVNGLEITTVGTDQRSSLSGVDAHFNASGDGMLLGAYNSIFSACSMAETWYIDGTLYNASTFGEVNGQGVWVPKAVSGLTMGNNGFHLDYTNAAAFGTDTEGSNHFTQYSFGIGDQITDTPTNNYPTLNSIFTGATIEEGGLSTRGSGVASYATVGLPKSGKFYYEMTLLGSRDSRIGFVDVDTAGLNNLKGSNPFALAGVYGIYTWNGETKNGASGGTSAWDSAFATDDVLCCAIDCNTGKVWWGKNGTWLQSGNPLTGDNPAHTLDMTKEWYLMFETQTSGSPKIRVNFGQKEFAYTAPADFVRMSQQNWPIPAVIDSRDHFEILTWSGNGTDNRDITGAQFSPNISWAKQRNGSGNHWYATENTVGVSQASPSSSGAATVDGDIQQAFNSDGIEVGTSSTINGVGREVIAFLWDKAVKAGIDVIGFTGDGNASRDISHNLGAVPAFWFLKNFTDAANSWRGYHKKFGATGGFETDLATAFQTDADWWNDEEPDATKFVVDTDSEVNGTGDAIHGFIFAEVPGFSKFGKYVGNGTAEGPWVWCDFQPKLIMIFPNSAVGKYMYDSIRMPFNKTSPLVGPIDTEVAEVTTAALNMHILSNGFKPKGNSSSINGTGVTYYYAAFAAAPYKINRAR